MDGYVRVVRVRRAEDSWRVVLVENFFGFERRLQIGLGGGGFGTSKERILDL